MQRIPRQTAFFVLLLSMYALTAACSSEPNQPSQDLAAILESYAAKVEPALTRHGDTTEEANRSSLRLAERLPKAVTRRQQEQVVRDHVEILEWAMPRLRADLDEMQRIVAPEVALKIHGKMIEAFTHDMLGISEVRGFYVGLLSSGRGDPGMLSHGNAELLAGRLAATEVLSEMQRLINQYLLGD